MDVCYDFVGALEVLARLLAESAKRHHTINEDSARQKQGR